MSVLILVLLSFSFSIVLLVLGFVLLQSRDQSDPVESRDPVSSQGPAGTATTTLSISTGDAGNGDLVPITFPGEIAQDAAKLTANGKTVAGYKFVYGKERNEGTAVFQTTYFWFAGSKSVVCELHTSGSWIPTKYAYVGCGGTTIPVTVAGNVVKFTLPGPNCYFYKPDITDITPTTSPQTIHIYYDPSSVLVKPPGATVVKSGQYPNLNVSGTVFLEPGTVIRGNGSGGQFVNFANGSTLIGAAIIDTNDGYSNICNITSANINITGPMFRKSQSFGFVVAGSNIQAQHIKVFSGVDGNDAISATSYTLQKSSVTAVDDAWAHKSNRGKACTNITVKDCICSSRKSCLKLGTESPMLFESIRWENVTAYDGCRLISLYLVDGGGATNVTFKNIIGFLVRWPGESRSGRWFDSEGASAASVRREQKNSPLRGCVIENIYVRGVTGAVVTPTGNPFDITLRNARLIGSDTTSSLSGIKTYNVSRTDIWPISV